MNRRDAVTVAQTQLLVTDRTLKADGVWGPKTDSTFTKSTPAVRSVVLSTAKANGLDESQLRGRQAPKPDRANVRLVVKAATDAGITGSSLVNLLANVEVESNFVSKKESHRYKPASARENIRAMKQFTDAQINALVAAGPDVFFESAYGLQTKVGKDLGNINPGDGAKFPGRGFLQITGRYNYAKFAEFSGIDVVNDPDKLLEPEVAAKAAAWYWKTRVMRIRADLDITQSAKAVNGHTNGLGERKLAALAFKDYA